MTKDLKELYEYGYEVFADETKFHLWLERKCVALGDRTPASFLTSKEEMKIVRHTFGRIEHGVMS